MRHSDGQQTGAARDAFVTAPTTSSATCPTTLPSSAREARDAAGRVAARYPLSPVQYAMVLQSLSTPDEGVYVLQKLLTLPERLDLVLFERALHELTDAQAALRTVFVLDHPEGPSQLVLPEVPVTLATEDWRHLDRAEQQRRLDAYVDADGRRPFDLGDRPPVRFALFRTGDDEYEFVWTTHHALMDGRSLFIVLVELFQVYEQLAANEPVRLPRRRPFADYLAWLANQDTAAAESFWRRQLAGITAPTPLNLFPLTETRRVGPAVGADDRSPVVDTVRDPGPAVLADTETALAEDATAALERLAEALQVSLNNVVQAGWAILLHQLAGSTDVLFGTTRAGRGFAADAADMVGLFLNTLPFRVTVTGDTPVSILLRQVRDHHRALRAVEHSSPTLIHACSEIPPQLPLFESVIIFENYQPDAEFHALGGAWERRDFRLEEQTNYPVTLYAHRGPRLTLELGYDRRRLADDVAELLLAHLRHLLEAMTTTPASPVAALPQPDLPGLAGQPARGPGVAADPAPDLDVEQTVARIWRDVLRRTQIGVEENFFDAGGNSVLLMRVLIGLQTELAPALTRVDMLRHPTIRSMASYLSVGTAQPAEGPEPAVAPAPAAPGGRQNLAELRRRRHRER
jgi:hypothetical protein